MPPKRTEMMPQMKNRLKIRRSSPLSDGFLHSSCSAAHHASIGWQGPQFWPEHPQAYAPARWRFPFKSMPSEWVLCGSAGMTQIAVIDCSIFNFEAKQ